MSQIVVLLLNRANAIDQGSDVGYWGMAGNDSDIFRHLASYRCEGVFQEVANFLNRKADELRLTNGAAEIDCACQKPKTVER